MASTFHTTTDTDRVRFTVPTVNLGVPYRIRTFGLSWGMATTVRRYDAERNLIEAWMGYEGDGGVSARWRPMAAGTYDLEVQSPCAAVRGGFPSGF